MSKWLEFAQFQINIFYITNAPLSHETYLKIKGEAGMWFENTLLII